MVNVRIIPLLRLKEKDIFGSWQAGSWTRSNRSGTGPQKEHSIPDALGVVIIFKSILPRFATHLL